MTAYETEDGTDISAPGLDRDYSPDTGVSVGSSAPSRPYYHSKAYQRRPNRYRKTRHRTGGSSSSSSSQLMGSYSSQSGGKASLMAN